MWSVVLVVFVALSGLLDPQSVIQLINGHAAMTIRVRFHAMTQRRTNNARAPLFFPHRTASSERLLARASAPPAAGHLQLRHPANYRGDRCRVTGRPTQPLLRTCGVFPHARTLKTRSQPPPGYRSAIVASILQMSATTRRRAPRAWQCPMRP